MDPVTMSLIANAAGQGLNAIFGNKDQLQKKSTLSPQQKQFQKGIYKDLGPQGKLGEGYSGALDLLKKYINPDSAMYQTLAEPHMRRFNEQTVPGLAERFAGMGALGGGLSSSGFGQALGAAGAGLQENLAALQAELQQKAVSGLLGQYNQQSQLGQNTPEFAYVNRQGGGPLSSALGGFAQGGGFDQLGSVFGSGAGKSAESASPYQPRFGLSQGYDNEFRSNPGSFGYGQPVF